MEVGEVEWRGEEHLEAREEPTEEPTEAASLCSCSQLGSSLAWGPGAIASQHNSQTWEMVWRGGVKTSSSRSEGEGREGGREEMEERWPNVAGGGESLGGGVVHHGGGE